MSTRNDTESSGTATRAEGPGPGTRGDGLPGAATSGGSWRRTILSTDLYQLTMAQVYLDEGLAQRPAQFEYFYRSNPDYGTSQAGYGVFAGLDPLLDWLESLTVDRADLDALAAQRTPDGTARFSPDLLDWLADRPFRHLELRGTPEARVVHPNTPLITVSGPLAAAQLLETALLNLCNYPTLIATKAARIVDAADGGAVLEFGMRRGPGGAVDDAARSALIAGCAATSNVQAAVALGRDPQGTHAHSLVQAYLATGAGELEAFHAYARRYPDACVLLVDTIDTLGSGVPNAIRVFDGLRAQGHQPAGVRLDSGDLAHLAVESARLLDAAGFDDVGIVLSGELDELTLWQVLAQAEAEARQAGMDPAALRRRLTYGVGTRLITSAGSPALGGVYKLTAIHGEDGTWEPALKLSENPAKVPIVGPKLHWRLYDHRQLATADLLTEPDEVPFAASGRSESDVLTLHHPSRTGVSRQVTRDEISRVERIDEVLFADGARRHQRSSLDELQARCRADVDRLDRGVRRLLNPHRYHVSLSSRLHRRQQDTIARIRRTAEGGGSPAG